MIGMILNRVVIQLVECYIWDVVVAGSNPVYPTIICPHSTIGSCTALVMRMLLVRVRLGARSCTGQILDQKIPVGFIFCTVGWSHGKQKYWRLGRVD